MLQNSKYILELKSRKCNVLRFTNAGKYPTQTWLATYDKQNPDSNWPFTHYSMTWFNYFIKQTTYIVQVFIYLFYIFQCFALHYL